MNWWRTVRSTFMYGFLLYCWSFGAWTGIGRCAYVCVVVQAEPIDFVLPVCVPDRLLWAAVEGYVFESKRGYMLEMGIYSYLWLIWAFSAMHVSIDNFWHVKLESIQNAALCLLYHVQTIGLQVGFRIPIEPSNTSIWRSRNDIMLAGNMQTLFEWGNKVDLY